MDEASCGPLPPSLPLSLMNRRVALILYPTLAGDYRAITGDIGLPGAQGKLLEVVAAAAKAPIVVLVPGWAGS